MICLIFYNGAGKEVKRYVVRKFEVDVTSKGWVTVYYTTPEGTTEFLDIPSVCNFKFEFMRA